MKNLLITFLLISCVNVVAQKIDALCFDSSKLGIEIKNVAYKAYKDKAIINKRYSSIDEVNNLTPELLLKSQYSAKNNEWLSLNYNKPMNWNDKQFERLLAKENYLELLFRLDFSLNNNRYSIIKVNANLPNKKSKFSYALLLRKTQDKWYIDDENKLVSNLSFLLMFLSVDDIYYLFSNQELSDNNYINEAISKIWSRNSFSFDIFQKEVGRILINSKYSTKPYIRNLILSKDKEGTINTESIIPYLEQSYCSFFTNEISKFDDKKVINFIELVKKVENYVGFEPKFMVQYKDLSSRLVRFIRFEAKDTEGNLRVFDKYFMNDDELRDISLLNNAQIKKFKGRPTKEIESFFK